MAAKIRATYTRTDRSRPYDPAAAKRRRQRYAEIRKRLPVPAEGAKSRRGAPDVFGLANRFVAIHYWVLRARGVRYGTALRVARVWGISERLVRKHAYGPMRQEAETYVSEALADPRRPWWALESTIIAFADAFSTEGGNAQK